MWQQAGRVDVGEDRVVFGTPVQFSGEPTCFCSTLTEELNIMSLWRCILSSANSFGLKTNACPFLNTCSAQFPPLICQHPTRWAVFKLSSSTAQTSLTGRSASSRSRGGSGMWGSKLLRLRHGDSSELSMAVAGGSQVTLPGASPAGTGVLACGCDWAVAAGSWSARCPMPGCERVPHVTAAPHSG